MTVSQLIAIEIAATLAACALSWHIFFGENGEPAGRGTAATPTFSRDGLLTFVAFSACAAPFYLDRLFVTMTLGGESAAQYAVLALFLTGASLLVNTVAQRIGPEAVRLIHRHGDTGHAYRLVARAIGSISGVWMIVMAVMAFAFTYVDLPSAIDRYRIEPTMLVPILLGGLLLNSGLLEFLVIGLDRERQFAVSALVFLVLTMAAAGVFALAAASSLLLLMWLLVACRAVYFAALLIALKTSKAR